MRAAPSALRKLAGWRGYAPDRANQANGIELAAAIDVSVSRASLLIVPVGHRDARGGAANDAGNADLDLPDGGRGNAANREGALPDHAPGRHVAFGAGAFALELLYGCERILAQPGRFHAFGGVNHLVEHRFCSLRLRADVSLEHRKKLGIARRVAGERVFRHVAHGELVNAVTLLRPRQERDDALDRRRRVAGEIIAP